MVVERRTNRMGNVAERWWTGAWNGLELYGLGIGVMCVAAAAAADVEVEFGGSVGLEFGWGEVGVEWSWAGRGADWSTGRPRIGAWRGEWGVTETGSRDGRLRPGHDGWRRGVR